MLLYALALTLSPAVRGRSWQVAYRWDHWLGVLLWLAAFGASHYSLQRRAPESDPFLLPLFALLSGWGMLTVWRLLPVFGLRQALWILLTVLVLILGLRLPTDLGFLRRYKYLWLTGSLLLTGLTLIFGTNPLGYGPHMWLGCCGVYLQPSEPLKLLLIAYLAAYMADQRPALILAQPRGRGTLSWFAKSMLPLLAPTLVMTGLALVVLLVQRDLGTASILLLIYAAVVYLTSGQKSILVIGLLGLALAGALGYMLFDVVQIRIDAWVNPWADPSGGSYQIVQSLLAIANGGLLGRGPGIGNPGLVPVAHSDLIYAAIAEEHGLVGALGLLLLIGLVGLRGLKITFSATNSYRRFLAAGLTTYLVGQSLLIIGGSVRLFPLTGVTLPFVSYGGSSLLISVLSILLLLKISDKGDKETRSILDAQPFLQLGGLFLLVLGGIALVTGWWSLVRAPGLLDRTDNARRTIADRFVLRGSILDRSNAPVNATFGEPGDYQRENLFPSLSNVVGYTNPTFGQAGLEASLDDYLRGLRGNPASLIWWNQLLYGQPPPGVGVRLTLDLDLQHQINALFAGHSGALVLLDAERGEILAMASYPGFDANQLDERWEEFTQDPQSPFLNRAFLGRYPIGELQAELEAYLSAGARLDDWPQLRLPGEAPPQDEDGALYLSPLQAALISAAVRNTGLRPAPQIVLAVDTMQGGWVPLPALDETAELFSTEINQLLLEHLNPQDQNYWEIVYALGNEPDGKVTWYWGGTTSDWQGAPPLVVALLIEEEDLTLASEIGRQVLREAINP